MKMLPWSESLGEFPNNRLAVHIQIRKYNRAHPQRTADLAGLIRYLLEVKGTTSTANHKLRLAGPPVTSQLIQRSSPFGENISKAAYDLAQQLFDHARNAPIPGPLPPVVYQYLLFSFPSNPPLRRDFRMKSDSSYPQLATSDFHIIVRIVNDLSDAMGIGRVPPSILVVHSDTRNYHAHLVVGMFSHDLDCSGVFKNLTVSTIKGIAASLYAGQGWDFPSAALEKEYKKIISKT